MVLDMGSEVTIIQERWFDEYLKPPIGCLSDASSWLRLEAANSLGFPYVGYFIADVTVLGTFVKGKGILVQKDPPGLIRHHPKSGILVMNVLGDIPDVRDLLLIIKTHDANPKHDIEGRVVELVGDRNVNILAWSSCNALVSGPRCTCNAMVEPLDGTLKGGLLLQTGLVGSIEGRFEVTIIHPTSDEVWLRSRSPVGRMYTVDVINRNPEHIVEFQELDDGLRVTMEPRQVTAFTRRISNQYDQNTQATHPQEQEWMERVNIGTIPSAYQHQLVELLRSHQ